MNRHRLLSVLLMLALLLALNGTAGLAQGPDIQGTPLGSGFTYQGQLHRAGEPVNDTCNVRFRLFDAATGGSQVGATLTRTGVNLTNGLFTVTDLDFGGGAFGGERRWLVVEVQCPGDADYTPLEPRQELTAAPYAGYSMAAPWSGLTGVPDLQARVFGTCGSGNAIRVVNADGSVTCEPVSGGGAHDHWGEAWSGSGVGLTLSGGSVGLLGSGSLYGLGGFSDAEGGDGVRGVAAATSGSGRGVYGASASTIGDGVYGYASAPSGVTRGVYGGSASTAGDGVYGYASATSGVTRGVYGEADSTDGRGVHGRASASSGVTYGVYGQSYSTAGYGVYGSAPAASGFTSGVYGVSSSIWGRGVHGRATATAPEGSSYGVYGEAAAPYGRGVYGVAGATIGTNYGVYGESNSTAGRGVYGVAYAESGDTYGVYGLAVSNEGTGVYGIAAATTGWAVGVYGRTESPDGYGVYYAGGLGGWGLVTSIVETPGYGWRHLYAVESPRVLFEDVGTAQLVNGRAVVLIDPIFAQAVNLAQPYQVFLTPRGDCGLYATEHTATSFTVRALDGRACSLAFDYRLIATRRGYEETRLAPAADPALAAPEVGPAGWEVEP